MVKLNLFGPKRRKRSYIPEADKRKVRNRQKYKCAKCKRSLTSIPIHYDHKKPIANGGSNSLRNIQALCPTCHQIKSDEDSAKRAKRRRREKEEDPFGLGRLLGPPPKRKGRKKSIWDVI